MILISALENQSIIGSFQSILSGQQLNLSGQAGASPPPTLPGVDQITSSINNLSTELLAVLKSIPSLPGTVAGGGGSGNLQNVSHASFNTNLLATPGNIAHFPTGAVETGMSAGFVTNASGAGTIIGAGPGLVEAKGTGTFLTEWGNRINGAIATCIETSGQIVRAMAQAVPLSYATVDANVSWLQARGLAAASGVTTWSAEAKALAAEGLPNTFYSGYNLNALKAGIQRGKGVVLGFENANVLVDTKTGKRYDAGVFGHSIAVEAFDATGIWAADPNTPGGSALVHYTWGNILAAKPVAMIIPK